MTKYGKSLVSNLPNESTEFLIDLCSGKFSASKNSETKSSDYLSHSSAGLLDNNVQEKEKLKSLPEKYMSILLLNLI